MSHTPRSLAAERRPWRAAFALLVLGAAAATGADDDDRYAVKLTAFDQLARPGEAVAVRAKLEHAGFAGLNPNLRGYPLRFVGPRGLDVEATTVRDGLAEAGLRYRETSRGPLRVRVTFPGTRNHRPAAETARLFVLGAEARLLVVDVDHTISDLRELDVPFTENVRIPSLPGSVETLNRLARDHLVVYLSARDESLYNKTRDWLRQRGFPDGPLFTRDYSIWESAETFKRQFIADLKKRFPHVEAGIGNTANDARAYLDNGLRAFILDPAGTGRFPEQALVVRSWRQIAGLLIPEERARGTGREERSVTARPADRPTVRP
jgi:hypothetical protein